jgi:hypothetical protein
MKGFSRLASTFLRKLQEVEIHSGKHFRGVSQKEECHKVEISARIYFSVTG